MPPPKKPDRKVAVDDEGDGTEVWTADKKFVELWSICTSPGLADDIPGAQKTARK